MGIESYDYYDMLISNPLCFTRMSSRCLWDADTDNYAEDVFMNVGTFRLLRCWGGGGDGHFQGTFKNCLLTFTGQLVLCGGGFRKLFLLRRTEEMMDDREFFQMKRCDVNIQMRLLSVNISGSQCIDLK